VGLNKIYYLYDCTILHSEPHYIHMNLQKVMGFVQELWVIFGHRQRRYSPILLNNQFPHNENKELAGNIESLLHLEKEIQTRLPLRQQPQPHYR